jgi:hypothetical protein
MEAYIGRHRGSMSRPALFLAISGLLLAGCGGVLPEVVRGAGGPVTAADTSGGEADQGIRVPSSARARGIPSPFGPGGRVGTWPG